MSIERKRNVIFEIELSRVTTSDELDASKSAESEDKQGFTAIITPTSKGPTLAYSFYGKRFYSLRGLFQHLRFLGFSEQEIRRIR